jgi:dipeptidyl-peptidase-4
MNRNTFLFAYLAVFLVFLSPANADDPATANKQDRDLTVEKIFSSGEFSSKGYALRWEKDGKGYLRTEASKKTKGGNDIVRYETSSGKKSILVSASSLIPSGASSPLSISAYEFSDDKSHLLIFTNTKKVWRYHTRGDYWVLDRATGELRQLGGDADPSTLMFAKFSPDGRYVAFVRERRLYIEDLRDRTIRNVINSSRKNFIVGTTDWVYEEEFGLRAAFHWSPDSESLCFWSFDTSGVPMFTLVNQTDSLYPKLTKFEYPKVGQRNSSFKIGVANVRSENITWLSLPGVSQDNYVPRISWRENSQHVIVQYLNRLQNTLKLLACERTTGDIVREVVERDDAWIDVHDESYWLGDGHNMTWTSLRSGWRQAELIDWNNGKRRVITPFDHDVVKLLRVTKEKSKLAYYIASPNSAAQRYLYCTSLDKPKAKRLTPANQQGVHQYDIDPTGRWAKHSWSSNGQPSQTELVSLPDHKVVRTFEDNEGLRKKLAGLKPVEHEFFKITNDNNDKVDGWMIRPAKLEKGKKYPLIVYVYGEPAGQTVQDKWGGTTYLWHRMLVERGYVVVSIDNRGTPAPRGREWRKSVYRKIGIIAAQDQAAGVKSLLAQKSYLDSNRVGVWGWSGGGSMTLNAMFKFPEVYHVGISIAPVPNQRYYDTIYQERYMGLPGDNVDGYIQGSPIHFAKNLEGKLLLIHGTGDDNCHYQGAESLVNELIKHNKQFTMFGYPNRSHSIREGANTTLHLRRMMTDYMLNNLPPGPK